MKEAVVKVGGKWYFWDNRYSYRHGPYPTKVQAEKESDRYYMYYSTGKKHDGLGVTIPGRGAQ